MWQIKDKSLYREFTFKDFKEAFSFMTEVAAVAEEENHHPVWKNSWNKVEIWLNTYSSGHKVTNKDKKLASLIDDIEAKFSGAKAEKTRVGSGSIKIYTDGGSRGNPGPSASGYVLMDRADKLLEKKGIYLGITTNNQAEYKALKFALEAAKKLGAKKLDVYMDSLLIVNQIKGTFKIKNADLLPIYKDIKDLLTDFEEVSFTHVPRALNALADSAVNEALDNALG